MLEQLDEISGQNYLSNFAVRFQTSALLRGASINVLLVGKCVIPLKINLYICFSKTACALILVLRSESSKCFWIFSKHAVIGETERKHKWEGS